MATLKHSLGPISGRGVGDIIGGGRKCDDLNTCLTFSHHISVYDFFPFRLTCKKNEGNFRS